MKLSTITQALRTLAAESDKVLDRDIYKSIDGFSQADNHLIEVGSDENLKTLMVLATNFCIKNQAAKSTEPRVGSMDHLLSLSRGVHYWSEQEQKIITQLLGGMTTHPIKHNGQAIFLENVLMRSTYREDGTPGVAPSRVPQKQELVFSGNAAIMGEAMPLTLEFLYFGEKTTIAELVADDNAVAIETLQQMQASEPVINALRSFGRALKASAGPDVAQGIQVFWPVLHEDADAVDYVVITPVQSAGFTRVFQSKLMAYKQALKEHYDSRSKEPKPISVQIAQNVIGGSKPQNASSLNQAYSGYNRQLHAQFFAPKKPHELHRRLLSGKTLLKRTPALPKPLMMEEVHFKARRDLARQTKQWCLEATELWLMAREDRDTLIEEGLVPASESEALLLKPVLTRDDRKKLETKLYGHLLGEMNQHKSNAGVDVKRFARDALSQYIERFFA